MSADRLVNHSFAGKKAGNPETVLQANWVHPPDVERWLRRMALGSTLNVCSGLSRVGDVRVDTDPATNRTVDGDLFKIGDQFAPLSFDTVICDPPFSYYSRFWWVNELARLTRRRLMISPDRTLIRLDRIHWKTRLFVMQATNNAMYLRLWYVFDRKNGTVDSEATNSTIGGTAAAEEGRA